MCVPRTTIIGTWDAPYDLGLGYNARDARQMDTVEVNLGVVGPAALARQTQNNESRPSLHFDAITHYGASLGNIRAHRNTGLELHTGNRIPNDFGTSPIRPAGDSNAPLEGPVIRRFSDDGLHVFVLDHAQP